MAGCRWEWTNEQEKPVAKRATVDLLEVCKPLENFLVVPPSLTVASFSLGRAKGRQMVAKPTCCLSSGTRSRRNPSGFPFPGRNSPHRASPEGKEKTTRYSVFVLQFTCGHSSRTWQGG